MKTKAERKAMGEKYKLFRDRMKKVKETFKAKRYMEAALMVLELETIRRKEESHGLTISGPAFFLKGKFIHASFEFTDTEHALVPTESEDG